MTEKVENSPDSNETEKEMSDKELNFRKQEQMYQRMLAEKEARLKSLQEEYEKKLQAASHIPDDDDDDDDIYLEKKKFEKKLNKFGLSTKSEIEKAMERAKQDAKEELKKEMWLENNPDFYDVLQKAEDFASKAPSLAKTILQMPDGFERQKLVYENIKLMGLHKPKTESTTQQKIEANRRMPYYQPSEMGTSPYQPFMVGGKDYSPAEKKNAYQQVQELINRRRA